MKSNKIDTLFKRKLENHTVEVSSNAWKAVQQKQNKKKKASPWIYSIAASLAIILLASVVVYQYAQKPETADEGSNFIGQIDIDNQLVSSNTKAPVVPDAVQQEFVKQNRDEESDQSSINSSLSNQAMRKMEVSRESDFQFASAQERINTKLMPLDVKKPIIDGKVALVSVDRLEKAIIHTYKVQIFYDAQEQQRTQLAENKIKLRDIADDLSLEDFRKAKNQLIASAFDLPKKIKFN